MIRDALKREAASLQPPDDTAMATTFRCIGCNQRYPSMHDKAAEMVAHGALPGMAAGPSTAAPETRKAYKQVMCSCNNNSNNIKF